MNHIVVAAAGVNATNRTVISGGGAISHSHQVMLCVAVPLLLILAVSSVAVLVLLIWCAVKKRHVRQTSKYTPVPREDAISSLTRGLNSNNLPYPPRVQLTMPKGPSIQPVYTTAGSLDRSDEMSSEKFRARYPFIQHRVPSPSTTDEKRLPRQRTRRKGNHKHIRTKNVIIRRGDTIDSEYSPETGPSRDPSPNPIGSPNPVSAQHAACLVPARHTSAPPNDGTKGAEVFLMIRYDAEAKEVTIRIGRVESLPLREDGNEVDAYVRVYFTPVLPARGTRKTSKTHTERRSSAPIFDEDIKYSNMAADELEQATLYIEALDYKSFGKHVLLGRAELAMKEVDFSSGEVNISLPLWPPQDQYQCNGTVLLSLCFEQENRKLSLIVLRAKDLNNSQKETDAVAKVTIELKDRVLSKLKTKKKASSCSPIFNEALSCTVGPENVHMIKITVAILNEHRHAQCRELGTVILSSQSTGDEQRHWNDIVSTPGKHIAEWHDLRS